MKTTIPEMPEEEDPNNIVDPNNASINNEDIFSDDDDQPKMVYE